MAGLLLEPVTLLAQHPKIFTSKAEGAAIRAAAGKYPLLDRSLEEAKQIAAQAIASRIQLPTPGEAGGPEHERHRQNYREMYSAGMLYTVTGEERYARLVRDMLLAYAQFYPKLGPHPLSEHQVPGKIFHQILNDNVWLVHTSIAYDAIRDWLTPQDRATIETNVLRPMANWLVRADHAREFDRIHNHGTWMVAAAGMTGYVLGDQNLVDMALYGTKKDRKGGFLKQLDLLFSPDGYYMEGPYYIRFALQPFYYFADAIHRNQPEIGIYKYRDQILRKALFTTVQTAFPNGVLPPINNASKSMDIRAPEVILANDLAYSRYGQDPRLLGVATRQNAVVLNGAGLQVAKDHAALPTAPVMSWGSVQFTDGPEGNQGGLGILRAGKGQDQSVLLMKYGVHGEGHGHFDKLHFIFFDQGREVVPDYGFGRWINIEPKFGGRYLPEGRGYAMQTIAHNTVVVDETSQNRGERAEADKVSGQRHFFSGAGGAVQAIGARANDHYPGVNMQRTMLLIQDERLEHPVVVDLYRLQSDSERQYDYPIHYTGQMMTTNLKYEAAKSQMTAMGQKAGYEYVWREAHGKTDQPLSFTWLDGSRYYSLVTSAAPGTEVLLGRIGANDPSFNLRSEPMVVVRRRARDHLFASVIQPHGYFNEARELSRNARPSVEQVRVVGHNNQASVVEVTGQNGLRWLVMVNNEPASDAARRSVSFGGQKYEWTGNYAVQGVKPSR